MLQSMRDNKLIDKILCSTALDNEHTVKVKAFSVS